MRRIATAMSLCLALGAVPAPAAALASPPAFETLAAGHVVHGFRALARYRDGAGHPMGARFQHVRSGFTLDVLRIQSVPQAFLWVDAWPTSDMGEPHTQEHLLLGKGNRGRAVATLDSMSLADSTAYTDQLRTVYQFETSAGAAVFYDLFEQRLGALLHPDYTDEEIRREVRNFGVTAGPDGLKLEEQGTVYNEMTSTYEKPWTRGFRVLARRLFGPEHPLAFDAGGTPEGLRALGPREIRAFHAANYHLPQMGMIASLPASMPLGDALERLSGILDRVEPDAAKRFRRARTAADLPANQGAAPGTIDLVGYPSKDGDAPGELVIAWPATRTFKDERDRQLADLFASQFAGDATTELYQAFVDSKARRLDVGATEVSAWFDDEQGHYFAVAFSQVARPELTEAGVTRIRAEVRRALAQVAGWPDGSPALLAFNQRVRARVRETRRALSKFVNSPPGFGFRGTYGGWLEHLDRLNAAPGFDKAVTLGRDLAAIESWLAGKKNGWREKLRAWQLTDVEPLAVAIRPDPALLAREQRERAERLAAETSRLQALYAAPDAQAALARYQRDFDQRTAEQEALAKAGAGRPFLASPPLTLDPDLDWRALTLARGVPLVASTFATMSGATFGLALRLDGVEAEHRLYLAALPSLLTEVGVLVDGKPVGHAEVARRLREEVLGVGAAFTRNAKAGRYELVFTGSGNDPQESVRAIEWLRRMALAPDWRAENLPRLRDVVDQLAAALRDRMKGAEEHWVSDPAGAFRWRHEPLYGATGSFLTREHLVRRLGWRLRADGPAAEREAFLGFVGRLAGADPATYAELARVLAADAAARGEPGEACRPLLAAFDALPEGARAHARLAAKELAGYLPDWPRPAEGWPAWCRQLAADYAVGPTTALAQLGSTRERIMQAGQARAYVVGARATQDKLLAGPVPKLIHQLGARPAAPRAATTRPASDGPRFVGLVVPNAQSGVFVHVAPGSGYGTLAHGALVDFLASKLYSGGGAHSIFMKTWGAGLAYSNGLQSSPQSGDVNYYAERCPELPQTLGFVIGELKKARPDPALLEYAYALAFDESRASWSYEDRGAAIAADLADGTTPDVVQRFREALLALRREPGLLDAVFARMPAVYGKVLPGLAAPDPAATYFVLGPETQLAAYERYLQTAVPAARLQRLHPQDFWSDGTD